MVLVVDAGRVGGRSYIGDCPSIPERDEGAIDVEDHATRGRGTRYPLNYTGRGIIRLRDRYTVHINTRVPRPMAWLRGDLSEM